ncbi:hypothetical protein CERZMDRAFT_121605 [Cercospora zeae-maydis SCOH1-5]|uniref:Uncharacterized protein n=1 Tax=Cercospora zeae-maydis SCOH1-5 TaxID=717836 RepID=A0A6A6FCN6_9PEZI|nr:hypothetical protein CERZMDRAFT_121605 [Cercospora zeae-maydis SCOH1-5]
MLSGNSITLEYPVTPMFRTILRMRSFTPGSEPRTAGSFDLMLCPRRARCCAGISHPLSLLRMASNMCRSEWTCEPRPIPAACSKSPRLVLAALGPLPRV